MKKIDISIVPSESGAPIRVPLMNRASLNLVNGWRDMRD
jgi:hypothetical protein